jgi:hypothetical protein
MVLDGSQVALLKAAGEGAKRNAKGLQLEKLLKTSCPNNVYPIRQKLRECTMMKNYMTSWPLTNGMKPEGDPGGGGQGHRTLTWGRGSDVNLQWAHPPRVPMQT